MLQEFEALLLAALPMCVKLEGVGAAANGMRPEGALLPGDVVAKMMSPSKTPAVDDEEEEVLTICRLYK